MNNIYNKRHIQIMNATTYYNVQEMYEWIKWAKEIPFIPFKPNWLVKPIPPVQQAVVRFYVTTKFLQKRNLGNISVYLDCYDTLGIYGKPYWEIYPYNTDIYRCDMDNVDDLVDAIQTAIDYHLIDIADHILGESK